MDKTFNVIISGVGGQGIVTLVSILDEACLIEGYDIKSSELHGLSQRGGSVLTHIRFGEKVYSPMVEQGGADLIIGLELLEGLRTLIFYNKKTKMLVNDNLMPVFGGLPAEEMKSRLKEIVGENLFFVQASKICKEQLQKEVVSGIYTLSFAVKNNFIPIKSESILQAIKNIIPEKYLEVNIKAYQLA